MNQRSHPRYHLPHPEIKRAHNKNPEAINKIYANTHPKDPEVYLQEHNNPHTIYLCNIVGLALKNSAAVTNDIGSVGGKKTERGRYDP